MRIFRMYASRLIRSAARSNWLWTIARPDIGARGGRDGWSVVVMALDSGRTEPPAREPSRGVLGFVQGLSGIRRALAALPVVRQDADDVSRHGRGSLAGVLHGKHEPDLLARELRDHSVPGAVACKRPETNDQRADGLIQRRRRNEGRSQPIGEIVARGELRAEQDDLPEMPVAVRCDL